jgi:hypothetical protein
MHRMLRTLAVLAVLAGPAALAGGPDTPEAVVNEIYGYYEGANSIGIWPTDPDLRPLFTPRLMEMLEADDELAEQQGIGRLGFDPFIDAQDFVLDDLDVSVAGRSENAAQVEASFTNFGQPTRIVYHLIRNDGRWLIDDIEAPDGPYPWRLGDILDHR